IGAPRGERTERGHEGLLGGVLGFGLVAEDPLACADETGRLALDQTPIRLAVSPKDGVDDRAVIDRGAAVGCRERGARDGGYPGVRWAPVPGHAGSAHGHDALARADPPRGGSFPHRRPGLASGVAPHTVVHRTAPVVIP